MGQEKQRPNEYEAPDSQSNERPELKDLWQQIEQRMGVCPSFFRLANADPEIARDLFALAKLAYLENPIPPLFKETLFTYLSKFCAVRYCIARHAAFLLGRGYVAGDPTVASLTPRRVATMLEEPLPEEEELPSVLASLQQEPAPLAEWPDFDSRLGKLCRIACAMVFLEPNRSGWSVALHRLLGPQRYAQLMLFLAFVRTAHFWTEVHAELRLDGDVEQLLCEQEILARPLLEAAGDAERTFLTRRLHSELLELREVQKMAEVVRESEEQLQLISDALPAAIAYLDAEQRYLWVNRPYALQFEQDVSEVVGRTVREVLGDRHYGIVRTRLEAALAGEEQDYEFDFEVPGQGTIGSKNVRYVPRRNGAGNVVGCVALIIDITRRKRAEQAVSESEARFRGTFENAAVGIAHVGTDGRWLRVNDRLCEIVGYTREEMLEKTFQQITHPDDLPADLALLDSLLRGQRPYYQMEKRYIRKNGTTVWILLTVTLQRDEQRTPLYCIGVIEDIDARKKAEEALVTLNETLEERVAERTARLTHQRQQLRHLAHQLTATEERERKHLAYAMHEGLQQMLVAAKTHLELAKSGDGEMELDRLDGLLSNILEESRSLTYSLTPPVLYDSDLFHSLQWLVRWFDDHYQFAVQVDAKDDFPPLDENEKFFLFGIVRELLLNAVKYSGRQAAHVKLWSELSEAVIEVTDEGQGFDPQALDRELELTGFGLFSIRERLNALGGTLQIFSAPQQGARFLVNLPASLAKEAQEQVLESDVLRQRASDTPSGEKNVRVLLVDDHDIVRQGYAMVLRARGGVEVVGEAANGRQAVDMIDRVLPDVIVMDVSLPEMDGIEATRRIKQRHPQVRVVGLSMHKAEDMAAEMISAGASSYLSKDDAANKLHDAILGVADEHVQ